MSRLHVSPEARAAAVSLAGTPAEICRRLADAFRQTMLELLGGKLVIRRCARPGCPITFEVGPRAVGGHPCTKLYCTDSCRVIAGRRRREVNGR